jgi:transposase, IS5 family
LSLRKFDHVAVQSKSNNRIKGTGNEVKQTFVDLGYRGVDADNPGVEVIHRGRIRWPEASPSMSERQKRQLKRRQAIEPAIGHVKHDNRMIRCYLKGSIGDALHAIALGYPVSCAAGDSIRWLMRAIIRLGLRGLFAFAFLVSWLTELQRSGARKMRVDNNTPSTSKILMRYALI